MKKHLLLIIIPLIFFSCIEEIIPKNPIDYVDPFIGTGFHGHTYPGATTPYGAVQLSPDTRTGNWDACAGYHYSDSTIIGFSHTHLSGTGCADLGDILFHPTARDIKLGEYDYIFKPHAFSHKDEKASAGYYSVKFKDEDIKAELTATRYAGVHRYTYAKGQYAKLIIDHAHLLESEVIDTASFKVNSKNEVSGMRLTQGWVTNQYIYFVAQFSKNIESSQLIHNGEVVVLDEPTIGGDSQILLHFGKSDGIPLVVKVGLSTVSEANARENLLHDVPDFDFDAVHKAAKASWAEAISDIIVEGGTDAQRTNFYTALYHTKVVPNVVSDVNRQYRRLDMRIATLDRDAGRRYSTFSLWDTFRAWHPLITLTDTRFVNEMINSLLDMAQSSENKELPIWPLSAGDTGTMIGYHSVSVIGDAYMKGIRGYDVERAYELMKHSSSINKKGLDYYIKYGFIPSNIKRESVSCLLEYAYSDWVLAQVAKDMGREEDYEEYTKRAHNYINVFDGHTKFFRGKQLDGNWETNFNEFVPGRSYTEATAWQYRFFVPHDVHGMAQLFGGVDDFITELDDLFVVESEIAGDMVDITGLVGQYAHGNEPSHHMAYLYNYVGQPWKTQAMTRRLLNEMYSPTPEGIIGNEDCGQMSAWYILSSLGFYSVAPSSNEFTLTSPLFDKATMKLSNGNTLTIRANNPSTNQYIDKVTLNGNVIDKNFITYAQLMEGGTLDFSLSSTPNKERGTTENAFPYSMTKGKVASIPYTYNYLNLFQDSVMVTLASATEGAEIYYTLNDTVPGRKSLKYEYPFTIHKTTDIKAIAYKEDHAPSKVYQIKATKAIFKNSERIAGSLNGTSYTYYEGKYQSVNDLASSKALDRGTMSEPSIEHAEAEDHFGYIFSGYIYAPEDGVYGFLTQSDDGSVLYIGKDQVVDNDGSHATVESTGEIALKKGYHPYRLLYFEDYEGEFLAWKWKRPSGSIFEPIPIENLFIR